MIQVIMLLIAFVLPGSASAAGADGAYPPKWPASDVTFTIPSGQGGEVDSLFSMLGQGFQPKTGMKFTSRRVEGRAGADAWARLVDDAPDGTVITTVMLPDVFFRSLQPDSGVSPDAMAVCNMVASMPCVLWVPEASMIQTLADFAEDAAKDSGLVVGGPGSFSSGQMAARMLDRELGLRTTYIPYTDTVTAAKAALNGQVAAFWGHSVPVSVPEFPSTKLKPIAVAAEKRLPSLPDVPTFRELGLTLVREVYIGLAVPLDTPKLTRQEISEYFAALAASPAFQAKARDAGFIPRNLNMEAVPVFLAEIKVDALRMAEGYSLLEQ